MRCDGVQNREEIIQAASDIFSKNGLSASLENIAEQAGVGIGTFYRHFRNRDELIKAVYTELVDNELLEAVNEGLAFADAWEGLSSFIHHLCEMQARDPGLNDMIFITAPTVSDIESTRGAVYQGVIKLIDRAKEQGTVRSDLHSIDLIYLIMANSMIVEATREVAPDAWRRFAALILDGFRSFSVSPLPEPISQEQITMTMRSLRPSKLRKPLR